MRDSSESFDQIDTSSIPTEVTPPPRIDTRYSSRNLTLLMDTLLGTEEKIDDLAYSINNNNNNNNVIVSMPVMNHESEDPLDPKFLRDHLQSIVAHPSFDQYTLEIIIPLAIRERKHWTVLYIDRKLNRAFIIDSFPRLVTYHPLTPFKLIKNNIAGILSEIFATEIWVDYKFLGVQSLADNSHCGHATLFTISGLINHSLAFINRTHTMREVLNFNQRVIEQLQNQHITTHADGSLEIINGLDGIVDTSRPLTSRDEEEVMSDNDAASISSTEEGESSPELPSAQDDPEGTLVTPADIPVNYDFRLFNLYDAARSVDSLNGILAEVDHTVEEQPRNDLVDNRANDSQVPVIQNINVDSSHSIEIPTEVDHTVDEQPRNDLVDNRANNSQDPVIHNIATEGTDDLSPIGNEDPIQQSDTTVKNDSDNHSDESVNGITELSLLAFVNTINVKFQGTNSSGIKQILDTLINNDLHIDATLDEKIEFVRQLMQSISSDKFEGWCGMRSCLSNFTFWGLTKGRSNEASVLYKTCSQWHETLTQEDLDSLISKLNPTEDNSVLSTLSQSS